LVGMGFASIVLLGTLHGSVNTLALGTWAFLLIATSLLRWQWIRDYNRSGGPDAPGELAHLYAARHARTAFAHGLLWGVISLALDHTTSPERLFVVSLVIVGSVGVSIYSLGPYRVAFDRFVHTTLALSWLAVMKTLWNAPDAPMSWALLLLLPVFWMLASRLATDYRDIVRTTLRLRIEKDQLIESLREQTRQAQLAIKTKSRFLASAAHDLRQPVHALALYADWLSHEPEMATEIIPKIRKSTRAVNALFDSLFDMARLESGAMRPSKEAVHLPELLDSLMVEFAPAAADKGLELRLRELDLSVTTDAVWLRRIVANLLSNAIRYTETGGVLVAVRTTERDGVNHARIEIWDTGRGIPPADQAKVFDEFFRSGVTRGSEQGFGLGLSIAGRLAEALGFELALQSREGRGTVVRLQIGPTSAISDSGTALSPITILGQARVWVLEPSADRALGLRRVLARRGLNVRVETSIDAFKSKPDGAAPAAISDRPAVLVATAPRSSATSLPIGVAQLLQGFPGCALVLAVDELSPGVRRHWASRQVTLTALPLRTNSLLNACADAFAQMHAQADG
jgi:signal transduction histidine kinase